MRILKFLFDLSYFYFYGGVEFARKKGVQVGKGCRLYIKSWGTEPFLITIGNNVTITSGVKIITHDGSTSLVFDGQGYRYQKYLPVKIGDNVFIGVNTIILPGVTIGNNVVVAAGSVVTSDLVSGAVYAGVPAKKISTFEYYTNKIKNTCASNQDLDDVYDSYKERVYGAIKIQNEKLN